MREIERKQCWLTDEGRGATDVGQMPSQPNRFLIFMAAAGGVTATDVVLTVTEMLRKDGVVGKFVEFYG